MKTEQAKEVCEVMSLCLGELLQIKQGIRHEEELGVRHSQQKMIAGLMKRPETVVQVNVELF